MAATERLPAASLFPTMIHQVDLRFHKSVRFVPIVAVVSRSDRHASPVIVVLLLRPCPSYLAERQDHEPTLDTSFDLQRKSRHPPRAAAHESTVRPRIVSD